MVSRISRVQLLTRSRGVVTSGATYVVKRDHTEPGELACGRCGIEFVVCEQVVLQSVQETGPWQRSRVCESPSRKVRRRNVCGNQDRCEFWVNALDLKNNV